jgi:hypothetical protein
MDKLLEVTCQVQEADDCSLEAFISCGKRGWLWWVAAVWASCMAFVCAALSALLLWRTLFAPNAAAWSLEVIALDVQMGGWWLSLGSASAATVLLWMFLRWLLGSPPGQDVVLR